MIKLTNTEELKFMKKRAKICIRCEKPIRFWQFSHGICGSWDYMRYHVDCKYRRTSSDIIDRCVLNWENNEEAFAPDELGHWIMAADMIKQEIEKEIENGTIKL